MPRYFLMRCAEARILQKAFSKGLWPVSYGCLERLNATFGTGDEVILIFTVSGSGAFQGCAKMKSAASQGAGEAHGALASCRIAMMHRGDLPYADAEHLINPLSEPPGPVRAGKDGTEIEPAVAEELIALLEKAAANPKPAPAPADGGDASPQRGGAAGAAAGGKAAGGAAADAMPGMVGAGLMGMPDPFLGMGGVNPMLAAMNPLLAMNLAMNPMAAAMMMAGMPGMMAAGMRPGAMGPLGAAAAAAAGGKAGEGTKAEPKQEAPAADRGPGPERREGPPGGRYGGRDERYDAWAERERYERERERYEGRGPRGPPPYGRDGPPPFMFREGRGPPDFRYGPPPGFDRWGPGRPGPYEREGPWGRDFRGPPRDFGPPGFLGPRDRDVSPLRGWERERSREREDGRPDLLRMDYEEYVALFRRMKELQAGGSDKQLVVAGGGSDVENAAAAAEGSSGGGGGGAAPDIRMMSEEDYVAHCERFSAQMHMPFSADAVRQAYRAMKAAVGGGSS